MILKALIQMISRIIVTAAFLLGANAAFAQVSPNETVADHQKTEAVKLSDRISGSETKSEQRGATGELVAVDTEKLTAPARFSLGPDTTAPAKNPFSKDPTAKPSSPAVQTAGSEWQFAFSPYLYMTGLSGTIGARGRTAEVDMSFGDVVENLNLGIMGTFEARKGRFVVLSDLMWIKLGEERDTPGDLYSSAKLGVNMFIFDPEVGYRVYEEEAGNFDILGGVRVMSVETNLNFRTGILPGFDASERKTWATPVIGAHGTLNLSPKFYLATKFDIGGGIGADFTGQFYGGAGYRITPKIALVGGYRYLNTDYDSDAGFVYNANMNGILLGAKFQF